MNNTANATATWTLAGITVRDARCEHCGRVMARCFRVTNPAGENLVLGRVCSRKLTGFNWSLAMAERVERIRLAEAAAAQAHGAAWTEALALQAQLSNPAAKAAATDAVMAMRNHELAGPALAAYVAERTRTARQLQASDH